MAPAELRRLVFELKEPTPLLNETLRLHWSERMRRKRALAWAVRVALHGALPPRPFARARVPSSGGASARRTPMASSVA